MMITEADTCRKYVLPKLLAAGWGDPHSFTEQRTFTGEDAKYLQSKAADELDALLPCILDKVFKGGL